MLHAYAAYSDNTRPSLCNEQGDLPLQTNVDTTLDKCATGHVVAHRLPKWWVCLCTICSSFARPNWQCANVLMRRTIAVVVFIPAFGVYCDLTVLRYPVKIFPATHRIHVWRSWFGLQENATFGHHGYRPSCDPSTAYWSGNGRHHFVGPVKMVSLVSSLLQT